MVLGSSPVAVISPSGFAPASSKEFLDIQTTIEGGFTLKRVRDMTRTVYNQYLLRRIMYFSLRYYKGETELVGLFLIKGVLELVVKIIDKYTYKELLKIPF